MGAHSTAEYRGGRRRGLSPLPAAFEDAQARRPMGAARGRIDDGETPLDAALRELEEELGLRLGADCVVGWLDDYATRSGLVITPVVLWCDTDAALQPNPDEVFAVYRIGLKALVDGEPRFVAIPESDRPVVQLPLGNDLIHAPTGAILYQFREAALADGSVSGSITWRSRYSRGGDLSRLPRSWSLTPLRFAL